MGRCSKRSQTCLLKVAIIGNYSLQKKRWFAWFLISTEVLHGTFSGRETFYCWVLHRAFINARQTEEPENFLEAFFFF